MTRPRLIVTRTRIATHDGDCILHHGHTTEAGTPIGLVRPVNSTGIDLGWACARCIRNLPGVGRRAQAPRAAFTAVPTRSMVAQSAAQPAAEPEAPPDLSDQMVCPVTHASILTCGECRVRITRSRSHSWYSSKCPLCGDKIPAGTALGWAQTNPVGRPGIPVGWVCHKCVAAINWRARKTT